MKPTSAQIRYALRHPLMWLTNMVAYWLFGVGAFGMLEEDLPAHHATPQAGEEP